jgi:putative addiction module killer protein
LGRIGGSSHKAIPLNQHRPTSATPLVQPRTKIARKSHQSPKTLQTTILQDTEQSFKYNHLGVVHGRPYCSFGPTIIKSDAFAEWIDNLRDRAGAAQVLRRLARLERGNPGNVAPVGEGLSELKIDFGPGYRVYFGQRGDELVIILCAGDKSSQDRDIKVAKKLWSEW